MIAIKGVVKPGTVDSRPARHCLLLSAFCFLLSKSRRSGRRDLRYVCSTAFYLLLSAFCLLPAQAQVESVASTEPTHYVWLSQGRIEGHLALHYSPSGAFSPDSSTLAVVSEEKIVLMGVREAGIQKVLKPRIPDITDLNIQAANFLAMNQLFLLGNGVIVTKGKGHGGSTPLLAFQWDTIEDRFSGKLDVVGGGGGFGPILYFPHFQRLVLYKASNFDLWDPRSGRMGRLTLPDLTQTPNVIALSPDGHWVLLAQIAMSSNPDPVVVEAKLHKFVDSLRGHEGTVLNISFSPDSSKVVTACEDGKLRIFSAPGWKLLQTLTGHNGPVHWAEFSPDGKWLVSVGEDKTARVWSVENGKLQQMLEESKDPLLTVSFSPDGEYLAASSEKVVFLWKRTASER
ncbi:MAG: WD40 repeat domain-containing protein [Terriglobia bacterium]